MNIGVIALLEAIAQLFHDRSTTCRSKAGMSLKPNGLTVKEYAAYRSLEAQAETYDECRACLLGLIETLKKA